MSRGGWDGRRPGVRAHRRRCGRLADVAGRAALGRAGGRAAALRARRGLRLAGQGRAAAAGEWGGVAPPIEAYQQQAQARIQAVVDEVLPNGARCEMHVHAMHKPAGRALLSFCATADLLVVGAKERGRLAGWLVGSTSDEALKNASCTVVVVRPPAQAPAEDAGGGRGRRRPGRRPVGETVRRAWDDSGG